ncbi:hypothetical protein HQ576_03290 [bacterium]|nr:hypothetical protein [bacterium]
MSRVAGHRALAGVWLLLGATMLQAAAAEAPVLLPWHDAQAEWRQAVAVEARVLRQNPTVRFLLPRPDDGAAVRIVASERADVPLPAHTDGKGEVAVRVPGTVTPGRPHVLLAYWSRAKGWKASPVKDTLPAESDDYATTTYGDAWDFDEGDQDGIRHWGDRPHHYGKVAVRGGRLVIPVTGPDPYFIWGSMFGQPADDAVERIDSKLYTTLLLRVRQSCAQAKWSLYVTDSKGRYEGYDFTVRGTHEQTLALDLEAIFAQFWDGREFRALRIDPTNDAPGATVEVDWVRLARPGLLCRAGVLLDRKEWQARGAVRALQVTCAPTAAAGEETAAAATVTDEAGRPVAGVRLAVARIEEGKLRSPSVWPTDEAGKARPTLHLPTRPGRYRYVVGLCDDIGLPARPRESVEILVTPGPVHHYELVADRRAVDVAHPDVRVRVWAADRFGNRMPVDIPAPRWTSTGGATVPVGPLKGAPAVVRVRCSGRPLTRHHVTLRDATGRAGSLDLTTLALKKHPIRLAPHGYLVDAEGKLFLPLGGFYANWPSGLPDEKGGLARAVDLFPCGPKPYPHGFPWPPDVEKQVTDSLRLCQRHGVTALRLMLRNMDIVGRVDPVQLKAVLHLFDLARPLGIRFNVALFEDYVKPPYVSRDVLEKIALPHYTAAQLATLPPHRARFLRGKDILPRAALRYVDDDAIACQKDYLRELLPHLASREEVFCYEFENEMVRPPMSWVNEMAQFIRQIDPRTLILGNPGPHEWPEPWRWREAKIDLFSYHPYTDGHPEADHGAVVLARSKWAAASGIPMFTGEGGINQSRWQPGIGRVPAEYAARGIRDQIWLSLCCGANGAFMWTAMHEAEMAEFGKVAPALRAVGIDLLKITRRRPRTVVAMPEDGAANRRACALAWELMSRGVDFDARPAASAAGYAARVDATVADEPKLSVTAEHFRPGEGYQLATLMSEDGKQALIYLRNVAGGIVNAGTGRPCHLRRPQRAAPRLIFVGSKRLKAVRAYDLDTGRLVTTDVHDGGGVLHFGPPTTHDFVIGLHR